MKNITQHLIPYIAVILCLSILDPLVPIARAQNNSKITVNVGQPNIWSLGQAHYLLSNMRERSRELGVTVPIPKALDPSSANGTRINILRTMLGADVGIDTVAGLQNSILQQRFDADLAQFTTNQARLDALNATYADAVREVADLTVQLASIPDKTEFADQRKEIQTRLAARTGEKESLKAQIDAVLKTVTPPSAPTGFKGTLPTNSPSPLPDDLKDMFSKLNATVVTPQLNASTTLENYVQMQYEVIAKQLTLLRDEVGPGQRLVFLEMPMSIYSVPKTDDDYIVRLEWDVNRFYGPDKGKCGNGAAVNERISLHATNTTAQTLAKIIANRISGLGVVVDQSAAGTLITIDVTNVPLQTALEQLQSFGLGFEIKDNVLRIAASKTLSDEAAQREKDRKDMKQAQAQQPQGPIEQGEPLTLEKMKRDSEGVRTEDDSKNKAPRKCWSPADKTAYRVIDIIPRQSALNVNDQHGTQSGWALTARFLSLFGLGGQVNFQRQRSIYEQFIQQEVYASAYGKGMSSFGWTFGPLPGTKRIAPGVRTTYAVLSIPSDASGMELKVAAKVYKRDVPLDGSSVKTLSLDNEGFGSGTYQMVVPNEETEGFWITKASYTPVEKGKQITVLLEGKYFSPLTGILVNGVPLKRAVSLAKNESSTANLIQVSAVDPAGEYEYLNPQHLILSFNMDANYVGTPLITLITPEKTGPINFFKLEEINFHFTDTSLAQISDEEPMFIDAFALENLELINEDANYLYLYLHGKGLRRGATFVINDRNLDTASETAEHLSPGLYKLKIKRSQDNKPVIIRYRNTTRQSVQEGALTFQQTVLSNYEITRYEPAQGQNDAELELIITISGQNAAPTVSIDKADGEVIGALVALGNHRFKLRIKAKRDPVPLMVTGVTGVTDTFDIGRPEPPSIARVVNTATNKPEGPGSKPAIVTLHGVNFLHVTRVFFGAKEATILQSDPQVILVNAPAGDEGPVRILLETNVNLRGKNISNIADFRTPDKAIYTYTK